MPFLAMNQLSLSIRLRKMVRSGLRLEKMAANVPISSLHMSEPKMTRTVNTTCSATVNMPKPIGPPAAPDTSMMHQ